MANGNKPLLKIDMSQISNHRCVDCQGTSFLMAHELKPVSPLISRSGKEEVVRFNIFICVNVNCQKKVEDIDLFPDRKKATLL